MSSTSTTLRLATLALCVGLSLLVVAVPLTGQTTGQTTGQEPGPGIGTTLNGAYVRMPTYIGTDRLQSIVVLRSDGRLIQAILGPGLTLDRSTTPATLRISSATGGGGGGGVDVTGEIVTQELPDSEGNHFTYTLAFTPLPGTLRIFRDGVRMTPGNDYILTGSTVTFTGHWTGTQYALVVADYKR